MCGSCTDPWRPIWWRRRKKVVVCFWSRSGNSKWGPLYIFPFMSFRHRGKVKGKKKIGRRWWHVDQQHPAEKQKKTKNLQKKKKKFFWRFSYLIRRWMDTAPSKWTQESFFFPHTEEKENNVSLRLYKNQNPKRQPFPFKKIVLFCCCWWLGLFWKGDTQRVEENGLSWEKEKDVEDTAVKMHGQIRSLTSTTW